MTIAADMVEQAPEVLSIAGADGFAAPAARIEQLPGPAGVPVLGNALQLKAGALHSVFEGWAAAYGPMYRFRLRSRQAIGISEPGLIAGILRHRPQAVARSPRVAELIGELGPTGLFTAEGERWRRQRKLVMRALTPEAVRHFFPVIVTVTERLLARWQRAAQEGRAVNVPRELKRYSIDVTTWLAMGVDVDTLNHDDNPLQDDVEFWFATIGRRLTSVFPYWRYLKLPIDRRTDRMVQRLSEAIHRFIADARARIEANPPLRRKPSNILEALIVARDEPGSEFTDDDVIGNVATMLFAGEDTTANAMAWLLYFLAVSPEAAERARGEADAVLGADGLLRDFDALDRLAYVEAAAVESMRLKPIAPVQGQLANVDMNLAGLHVPKGTLLFLLPRLAATDAAHFEAPAEFRPERWLDETGAAGNDAHEGRHKLFPFGGGPRHCPGRYLAMVEMRMVAAMAVRNFGLSIDLDPAAVHEQFTFTLGPSSLPIRFTAR